MLTFIYKTGFENSVDGANFKPPRKNSKAAKQCADLCSDTTDEVNAMCSYHSNDTCGDGCFDVTGERLTAEKVPYFWAFRASDHQRRGTKMAAKTLMWEHIKGNVGGLSRRFRCHGAELVV